MYPDILANYRVLGGGADGVSSDTVLCVGVFYLRGVDDTAVGVSVVIVAYCDGGGECAGVVSAEGAKYGVGFDDGTEGEVYLAISGDGDCVGDYVGGGDAAADIIRPVDETVRVDGGGAVCADMPHGDDVFYGDIYNGVFVPILSVDAEGLTL